MPKQRDKHKLKTNFNLEEIHSNSESFFISLRDS